MRLPLAYPIARTVTDEYLWVDGLDTNIKLRSWPNGASLKFKHKLESAPEHGTDLWQEDLQQDFAFPLEGEAISLLTQLLGRDLGLRSPVLDPGTLLQAIRNRGVKAVTVSKLRWLYSWTDGRLRTFVELAELSTPVEQVTVGIEDCHDLSERSSEHELKLAQDAVVETKRSLGLPGGLISGSYLTVVAKWGAA